MATVLVVDDDADIRDLITLRLEVAGHKVMQAADGDACMDAVRNGAPDLILLDIQMPRVNGIDVCRQLKSDPAFSTIPIMLLTARGQESDVHRGFEAGADDYIVNPFSLRELQTRLQRFLR